MRSFKNSHRTVYFIKCNSHFEQAQPNCVMQEIKYINVQGLTFSFLDVCIERKLTFDYNSKFLKIGE